MMSCKRGKFDFFNDKEKIWRNGAKHEMRLGNT